MISLEQQQIIASQILNQPLDIVKKAGYVDDTTKIFCIVKALDQNDNLLYGEQLKGYKGGYTLLVGQDGGVFGGSSAYSLNQLLDMYIQGKRSK